MPTAAEYDAAAATLEGCVMGVQAIEGRVRDTKNLTGLTSTSGVRTKIEGHIDDAGDSAVDWVTSLTVAISELEGRAQVCRDYAAALAGWRAALAAFEASDDGTGFWSDDWSTGERQDFYDKVAQLPRVVLDRIAKHSSLVAARESAWKEYTSDELAVFTDQPEFQNLSAEHRAEALDRLARGESMELVANLFDEGGGLWGGAISAVGRGVGFATETATKTLWDRGSTFVHYEYDAWKRRLKDPGQFLGDLGSWTFVIEEVSAAEVILLEDGELFCGDPDGYCGTEAECIYDVGTPKDAITTGHTIRFSADETWQIPPDLVAHETQHVYDIEIVGGMEFYLGYAREYVVNRARGMSHKAGYESISTEVDGYEVQDNYDKGARPSHDGPVYPHPGGP